MTNWLEAVYLKQVVHPGLLVPHFKILGQSNIVVSRSPVQIPESAHFFFFFFFLLSLMFSKVKATAFVGSETDRFL